MLRNANEDCAEVPPAAQLFQHLAYLAAYRMAKRKPGMSFPEPIFPDPDSVSTLVTAKLMKPLGHRTKRASMRFATCEVLRRSEDIKWLDRATNAVYDRAGRQEQTSG